MNNNYVPRREACKILGIHYHTLYKLANKGEIETMKVGGQNLYNVVKYMNDKGLNTKPRRKICYCRVSSIKQKQDLERQIEYMKNKYDKHEIISDIGSGLNMNREGLNKIIDYAINGEIEELVIAYKDRLTRFGYELIENIIKKYSNGIIKIENKNEEKTPEEEITKDIITIMNVYVAKINGSRKYKNK